MASYSQQLLQSTQKANSGATAAPIGPARIGQSNSIQLLNSLKTGGYQPTPYQSVANTSSIISQPQQAPSLFQKATNQIKGIDFKNLGKAIVGEAKAVPGQTKQAGGIILDNFLKTQQIVDNVLVRALSLGKQKVAKPSMLMPAAAQLREQGTQSQQKAIQEYQQTFTPTNSGLQKYLEMAAFNLPQMAATTGLTAATAILTKNPALATAVGVTSGYGMGASEVYNEARSSGVTDKQALPLSMIGGAIIGAIDFVPLTRLIGKTGAVEPIKKSFVKKVAQGLVSIGVQSGFEGITEGVQEVVGNAAARTYDENRSLLEGVKEAAVVGALLGGFSDVTVEGAIHLMEGKTKVDTNSRIEQAMNTPADKRTTEQTQIVQALMAKELTPDEAISYVVENDMDATDEGKQIMQAAVKAKQNGQTLRLSLDTDGSGVSIIVGDSATQITTQEAPQAATAATPTTEAVTPQITPEAVAVVEPTTEPTVTPEAQPVDQTKPKEPKPGKYGLGQYYDQQTAPDLMRTYSQDATKSLIITSPEQLSQAMQKAKDGGFASLTEYAQSQGYKFLNDQTTGTMVDLTNITTMKKMAEMQKAKKSPKQEDSDGTRKNAETKQATPQSTVSNELLAEARKYKSAREFIRKIYNTDLPLEIPTDIQRATKNKEVQALWESLVELKRVDISTLKRGENWQKTDMAPGRKIESPIVINGDGLIFDGHHRVNQAIANGDTTIQAKIVPWRGVFEQKLEDIYNQATQTETAATQETAKEKTGAVLEDQTTRITELQSSLKDALVQKQDSVDQALSEILTEMDVATAGQRIFVENANSTTPTVVGIKSTFPSWVPQEVRTRKLFDRVMTNLINVMETGKYPEGNRPKQRALFDAILGEVDSRAGTDTSAIRRSIMEAYDKQVQFNQSAEAVRGSTEGRTESTAGEKTKTASSKTVIPKDPIGSKSKATPVGTGKTKNSRLYQRVKDVLGAEYDSRSVTYNELSLEKQAESVSTLIETDPDRAARIARGIDEPPAGMTQNAVSVGLATLAETQNDFATAADLWTKISLRATRLGQEIVSLRGYMTTNNPLNAVKRVINERVNRVARQYKSVIDALNLPEAIPTLQKVDAFVKKEAQKVKREIIARQKKIMSAQEIINSLKC